MWTDEMVERLKKYVESNRYFLVKCHDSKVYGIDPRRPDYGKSGWAAFYTDRGKDDPQSFEDCSPSDFKVVLLKPVNWMAGDPDWSEADKESWAAYIEGR